MSNEFILMVPINNARVKLNKICDYCRNDNHCKFMRIKHSCIGFDRHNFKRITPYCDTLLKKDNCPYIYVCNECNVR